MKMENMSYPLGAQKKVRHGSKRRLILLIILLICTLSLLGSATYAWLTQNQLVGIDDLTIEVTVANGIEISADAAHWSQLVGLKDFKIAAGYTGFGNNPLDTENAGSINKFPAKLKNVSSLGNIDSSARLEMFHGVASTVCTLKDDASGAVVAVNNPQIGNTDGISLTDCEVGTTRDGLISVTSYNQADIKSCSGKAGEGTAEAGLFQCGDDDNIIAFDMYLKTDSLSTVYLAPGSQVVPKDNTDYGLKNTIRVAFVTLGTQPTDYYYALDEDIYKAGDTNEGKASNALCEKAGKDETDPAKKQDLIDKCKNTDNYDFNQEYAGVFGGYAGAYGARTMDRFGSIHIWEPNAENHRGPAIDYAVTNYHMDRTTYKNGVTWKTDAIFADPSDTIPMPLEEATYTNSLYFAPQVSVGNDYASICIDKALDNSSTCTGTAGQAGASAGESYPYKNAITYYRLEGEQVQGEGKELYTAPAGVTKIRVYIWIEGNDYDTENSITGAAIDVRLMFTTSESDAQYAANKDNRKTKVEKYYTSKTGTSPVTYTPARGLASHVWKDANGDAATITDKYTKPYQDGKDQSA